MHNVAFLWWNTVLWSWGCFKTQSFGVPLLFSSGQATLGNRRCFQDNINKHSPTCWWWWWGLKDGWWSINTRSEVKGEWACVLRIIHSYVNYWGVGKQEWQKSKDFAVILCLNQEGKGWSERERERQTESDCNCKGWKAKTWLILLLPKNLHGKSFFELSINPVHMWRTDLWQRSPCLPGKVGLLFATGRDTGHVWGAW